LQDALAVLFPTLLVVLAAALVAWSLVAVLIQLAPQIGLIDRPNARSSHARATPRGGGIGFVVAAIMGVVIGRFSAGAGSPLAALGGDAVGVWLLAAVFIAAISLRDDFKSLGVGFRFGCHLAAALALGWGAAWIDLFWVPWWGEASLGWMGVGVTVLWVVGMTNVYNFMDGIDGIAGVQAVAAAVAWGVAGWWLDLPAVVLVAALVGGGALGFLRHNWSPARIFMGDVGSAFLGLTFAALPLLALEEVGRTWGGTTGAGLAPGAWGTAAGVLPVFGGLVVWPFVGDGVFTFLRRLKNREKVWEAHRSHLYQRLTQCGWSHARVSSLYGAWAVVCGAAGLVVLAGAECAPLVAVLVPALSLAGLVRFVGRCERRREGR
jgi:UDP-N-acetylmuramyl pentapeptide phosphotransferase/UDP-N-acetylglucosamine-1-phosphate transferase